MKTISLHSVIQNELEGDAEFAVAFEKELLINAIAKMVITLRKNAKLTQQELATRAGTSQPTLARLERGTDTRIPSLSLLARLARAADATLNLKFEFKKTKKEKD